MQGNNLDIARLNPREIAGEGTANPLIDWINALTTTSDYLTRSPNAYGGIDIDLNFAQLANSILALVQTIAAEFKASVSGDALTVAGGHILLPGAAYSIPQYTRNLASGDNGKCLCLATDTASSDSGAPVWQYEWVSAFPTAMVAGPVVRLPICTVAKTGGAWGALQHHLGAFIFAVPPAPLIAGYDYTKAQSLDQRGGVLQWATYGTCTGGA